MATVTLITEDNSAQPFTVFASFKKKLVKPVTNGINMSKTGIIFFLYRYKALLKYFTKKTHDGKIIKPNHKKYHYRQYHDQDIITYLATLQ